MLRWFCSCRHARSRACLPCLSKALEPQPGLRLSKTQTRGRDCAARKAWGRPCPSLPPPLRSGLFVPSNTREKHVCHTKAAKNSSTLTARLQRRTAHVRASGALHQADGRGTSERVRLLQPDHNRVGVCRPWPQTSANSALQDLSCTFDAYLLRMRTIMPTPNSRLLESP